MSDPIELYYWPTPNGWKISIALLEMDLPFRLHFVDINAGEQFDADFRRISANGRIPAIVDPDGPDGAPVAIFESGAILSYLARKTGRFYGASERERIEVDQWLFWQVGNVGPMAGQAHHFLRYAPAMNPPHDLPYAKDRYRNEVGRLYQVLDHRLADRDFVAGPYSIADMAIWPWASRWQRQEQDIDRFPHMKAWFDRLEARPAVRAGRALGAERRREITTDRAAQRTLFGQTAAE